MTTSLHGTIALVTGAGRGLGAALASALAERGCRPILAGRDAAALERVAADIRKRHGLEAESLPLDLADAGSVVSAAGILRSRDEPIDILVNNGAMWLEASEVGHSPGEVLAVMNSAVTGTFLLTQELLASLRRSQRPDIVTIGSISSLPNAALQTVSVPFYAAKRAQSALADGFAQMLSGTPIRSIVVHPPYLDDLAPGTPEWEAAASRQKGERGTNRDIADAVLFAVTRPRHVTLSIVVNADEGGLHPA